MQPGQRVLLLLVFIHTRFLDGMAATFILKHSQKCTECTMISRNKGVDVHAYDAGCFLPGKIPTPGQLPLTGYLRRPTTLLEGTYTSFDCQIAFWGRYRIHFTFDTQKIKQFPRLMLIMRGKAEIKNQVCLMASFGTLCVFLIFFNSFIEQ